MFIQCHVRVHVHVYGCIWGIPQRGEFWVLYGFISSSFREEVLSGGSSDVVTNGDVRVRERGGGEGERGGEGEGERGGEGEGEREGEGEGEREGEGSRRRSRDEVFTETASAQSRHHSIMRTSGE